MYEECGYHLLANYSECRYKISCMNLYANLFSSQHSHKFKSHIFSLEVRILPNLYELEFKAIIYEYMSLEYADMHTLYRMKKLQYIKVHICASLLN